MTSTRLLGPRSLGLLALTLVSTLACVGQRPLGTACPCAPGWMCDTSTQMCVEPSGPGNGPGPSGGGGQGGGAAGMVGGPGGAGGAGPVVDTSYPDACPALHPPAGAVSGQLVPGCPLCTRRLGPGNAHDCPQGGNATGGKVIGPAGGTITVEGQQGQASGVSFELDVPPGALTASVMLTVTETDLSPPATYVDYSPVYRIGPVDVTFAKPATLRVPNSNSGALTPTTLTIYESQSSDPCAFLPRADSFANAGFVTGSITSAGYLFVGVPKTGDQVTCP
jgi:hypothetical protein